jgi:hypothetical protein
VCAVVLFFLLLLSLAGKKKRNNQKKSYTTFHGKLVFRVFRFFGWGVGSVEGLVVVVLMSGVLLFLSLGSSISGQMSLVRKIFKCT